MADRLIIVERRLLTFVEPTLEVPKPTEANTGPRIAITGPTLDSAAAKALAASNGNVVQGRRIENLQLSAASDWQYQWLDCELNGAFFGVDAWFGQGTPPSSSGQRAVFEHCVFQDCSAIGLAGQNWVAQYCEFTRNGDDVRPTGNNELYASLLHHMWAGSEEAHGDNIQFFGGDDVLVHWNTIDGHNAPTSPFQPGGISSSALQTSDGGVISNTRWNDNWVDGGVFTLRGAESHGGLAVQMEFRRNKHGRNYGSGPITGMGSFNGGLAVSDYDESNVWEDDGLPVLEG